MRTAEKRIPLRLYQKRPHKVGQSPGTLTTVGQKPKKPTGVTVLNYDHQKCEMQQIGTLSELGRLKANSTNSWINVEGITDTNIVAEIGQIFDIHPLVLEDTVNPRQRIKIEVFDDYIFIVLKVITYSAEGKFFSKENVSLILGKRFLILFREETGFNFYGGNGQ